MALNLYLNPQLRRGVGLANLSIEMKPTRHEGTLSTTILPYIDRSNRNVSNMCR